MLLRSVILCVPLLLALVLVARHNPAPPTGIRSVAQAAAFLKRLGYVYTTDGMKGVDGTLTHGGHSVRLQITTLGYDAQNPLSSGAGGYLSLKTEFDVPIELPQRPVPPDTLPFLKPNVIYFAPRLGRTVEVYTDVRLPANADPRTIKAQFDRYWTAVEHYAQKQGALWTPSPKRAWSRETLSDDLRLSYPDLTSLTRLFQAWGYAPEAYGDRYPLNTLGMRAQVTGQEIYLDNGGPLSGMPERSLTLRAEIRSPVRKDRPEWTRRSNAGRREVKGNRDGSTSFTETIPLAPPLRVGELRRRLAAFARDVRAASL